MKYIYSNKSTLIAMATAAHPDAAAIVPSNFATSFLFLGIIAETCITWQKYTHRLWKSAGAWIKSDKP